MCDDGVAPYADIQDAIDAATDGDVITVCAGTYGPVEVTDVDVTLEGVDGAERTIVDGGAGTGLTVDAREVTVRGLTLRGEAPKHGAVAVSGANATLVFEDVRFEGSTSGAPGACYVVILDGGDATFERIVFTDNEISGSGIQAFGGGSMTIRHSVFTDNSYDPAGGRSGLLVEIGSSDVAFGNNLVYDNISTVNLLYFSTSSSSYQYWVYNNVFYGNQVGSDVLRLGEYVDFENNIVAFNDGPGLGNGSTGGACRYSDIYGNSGGDLGSMNESDNCLSVDPRFTDPDALDFTLEAGFSPCIDAGNPLSGYNDVDGSRNDMGAYGGPAGGG